MCSWVSLYFITCKGISGTGKLVYFTSTFPFVVLFVLGVQGWSLPGAADGIAFYLTPNIKQLSSISVWNDAAGKFFQFLNNFKDLGEIQTKNQGNPWKKTVFVWIVDP
jgi:SNF family Na+-dependent transporter